jgi:hypothetical protein
MSKIGLLLLALLPLVNLPAQIIRSGNGDGTHTNPVIYSDYPDPDVTRVTLFHGFNDPVSFNRSHYPRIVK